MVYDGPMTKTFLAFVALILAACASVAIPDARERFYETECINRGGIPLWLANGPSDQRPDGYTKPYCRIDGIDVPM